MSRAIRVVFLTFYFEAWDALEGIYLRMLEDSRFDPMVVTIPRKLTGYEDFTDQQKITDFFDARNIEHTMLDFPDGQQGLLKLKELKPDFVFLNYPWQRNYQTGYQIENLTTFTKVCYVPYFSSSLVKEPGEEGVPPHQYTQPTHQLAHMVFLQDGETQKAFASIGRKEHVYLTGTPKIDALLEAKSTVKPWWPLSSDHDRFRLVWAPHHTYAQRWLNFGHFNDQRELMLDYAKSHPEIDIVFRPHPFLFGTMTDRDVMTQEEVTDWRARWNALPNTYTDEGGPMSGLLLATDALLTDGVSFLVEYPLISGKPSIFWEKEDHWEFTNVGELAADASITVHTWAEVDSALNRAQLNTLPDRSKEISTLNSTLRPLPASAAETIVELVAKDFHECTHQS